ncbi:MAG: MATE family efflux transporter [Treponema sp.]|nr:MATE family efflux transporter [Treponema sp.]
MPDTRNDAADRLGTEPVGRLLLRFSLPAITGMLVSALYNLVDRIFVGRGVNEAALAGLTLVMPLVTVSLAFAMLFGIGSANMISMRLGQGRRQEAENTLNHCLLLLTAAGLILTAVGLIFIDEILALMGAQYGSLALDYAKRYFRILLVGSVIFQVGFGFSHCTRAQGFPIITMIGMLLGAGINIVLSALFVLVFQWGIEGAAWATVISQFISCVWILSFSLSKKAVIRLRPEAFKPSLHIVREIMVFGSAQFFMQFVMSTVQLLYNISIGWYGAYSLGVEQGGDIALSGMSIITAISMLILMPVFGITHGAQPILGYNYGAKKFDRVLKTYVRAVAAATCVCIAGFIVVQSFPLALVRLFVPDGSEALYYFTPRAMRTMMLLLPLSGFQFISAIMFAVTGRPKVAILLNLLRQCIVLIPCLLIFGRLWGLTGIVAAGPVADGFSFVFTGIMITRELRKLRNSTRENRQTA